LSQPERSGQSGWARPDDSHLLVFGAFQLFGGPWFFQLVIGHETFSRADGHRFIDVAAPAFVLAKSRAHTATSQGKGVPFAMDLQGLGILALSDQRDIRRNINL
jgi:hypothetical protein